MRCDKCIFWIKDKEEDLDGNCRRYPPTPFPKVVMHPLTHEQGIAILAFWTKTRPELWCGEGRRDRLTTRLTRFFSQLIKKVFVHRREECLKSEKQKDMSTNLSQIQKSSLN